jgi:flagellin
LTVAITNLTVARENFAAAESQIRDTDVAQQAAELTRLGILQQAGSAVLAQANQQPALALSLLG